MIKFNTADEVFDGLEALSFKEQVKRLMFVFRKPGPLLRSVAGDPRFSAWAEANREALVAADNRRDCARWQNELSRKLGEPELWQE